MKVTVSRYLNVRIGEPSVNARCVQYLAPGSEIEVEDKLYKGDRFEDANTWFKDAAGNFYWSGGVTDPATALGNKLSLIPPLQGMVDYGKILSTAAPLPANAGNGVKVALLDSGVKTDHPALKGAIVESKSFIAGEIPIVDKWGHGTMMAGYIAGRSSGATGIRGVAPGCALVNYKVVSDDGATNMQALKNAFNHILRNQSTLKIDIINLSLSVSDLSFVDAEITKLSALGIQVVVAAGDESLFSRNFTELLAKNPTTIAVGAINSDKYIPDPGNGPVPARVACYFFNEKLYTSSSKPQEFDNPSGDSIYTALISGLLARIKSTTGSGALNTLCFNRKFFNTLSVQPYTNP